MSYQVVTVVFSYILGFQSLRFDLLQSNTQYTNGSCLSYCIVLGRKTETWTYSAICGWLYIYLSAYLLHENTGCLYKTKPEFLLYHPLWELILWHQFPVNMPFCHTCAHKFCKSDQFFHCDIHGRTCSKDGLQTILVRGFWLLAHSITLVTLHYLNSLCFGKKKIDLGFLLLKWKN